MILSIVHQTVSPTGWIIVSDGSTDRTDEIVRSYADKYNYIELHRITEDHPRNLTAQERPSRRGGRGHGRRLPFHRKSGR